MKRIVFLTPAILLLACALIVGCQGSDSDNGSLSVEDDTLRVTLPGTLRQLPEGGSLEAFYTVGGGSELPMILDNDTNQASVTTDPIPTGRYKFEIIFRFMDPDFQSVTLSMVVRELDVVAGSNNSLNLGTSDYTYPDEDNDVFINLQEVIARTDPNDPDSKPSPNRVFVTSATGTGDLSTWTAAGGNRGLEAAVAVCQSSAQGANRPGTYKAWMSDVNNRVIPRLH